MLPEVAIQSVATTPKLPHSPELFLGFVSVGWFNTLVQSELTDISTTFQEIALVIP